MPDRRDHPLLPWREPGYGFVLRWCPVCGRSYANAEEHDRGEPDV